MKTFKLNLVTILLLVLISCGSDNIKQPPTADCFAAIESELKDKFGNNAYFTDLMISYNHSVGNIIGVTVTDVPESLKLGQWNLMQNAWKQNSDITLEIPDGTKAADFMFQLDDNINLCKLGELTEKSRNRLSSEKDIENPALKMAFVKFPKNGDISNAEYHVMLEP